MKNFTLEVNKDSEDIKIVYKFDEGIELSIVAQAIVKVIEDLAAKNKENVDVIKLGLFMLLSELLVGHKLFKLNHFIVNIYSYWLVIKEKLLAKF